MRTFAALVALLVTSAGCVRERTPKAVTFAALAPGIAYATMRVEPGDGSQGSDVHVVRVDPALAELVVVHDPKLTDAMGFRKAADAVAAINGIYFDPQFKPLGLLVSQGVELSRLRRVDHGVFALADGKPSLQHAKSYRAPPGLEFAVECGPRFVVGGEVQQVRESFARRTVIGSDRAGNVVVAASVGVLRLRDLARTMVAPPEAGGIEAVDLLNLDGGSSTMFDMEIGRLQVKVRSPIRIPVGIAVRPRAHRREEAPTGPTDGPSAPATAPPAL